MPGLLTLRPLASAAKAAKSAAGKNAAVGATRAEKVRDDARPQGGQGKVSPTAFARARMPRGPSLHRTVSGGLPPGGLHPVHHFNQHLEHQALAPAQAQQQLAPGIVTAVKHGGDDVTATAVQGKRNGLEISQRVGGVDYSSSGSEHEPNSVCLAEMVFDYIEDDLEVGKCGRARCNCGNSCSGPDHSSPNENDDSMSLGGEIADVLLGLLPCGNPCERSILASVTAALEALDHDDGHDQKLDEESRGREFTQSPSTKRSVMSALRSVGYNAAICKSRWEHAGGFPGGDYEYIDVMLEVGAVGKKERILVDIDFKAQLEIARPTCLYSALLQQLPATYVGRADRLQQIVNIMCDAAKRSLKKKGLHLPPWRKPDYIRAKWFSGYRRTTNEASLSPLKSHDFAQIALRGTGWDSKFTTEMEKSYLKAADLKLALRDCIGDLQQQRKHEDEPEGKVRGANRLGFLGPSGDHSAAVEDTDPAVAATEWEPPLVIPKISTQRGSAAGKVGGLVAILKESGMMEDRVPRKELPEHATVASHRRQVGALSREMAVV